ncbi:MAG: MFS transporter, partial [Halofilum sp. (in: g-proteobacteria)]
MKMIGAERRAAGALAGIYALRMLGLFLVLPVLALAARDIPGATPALIGLAVGIYGLTQAALQIPFGLASDRLGRKRVIAFGLVIFALGSVLAALADSMVWLIVGRALQGAGAIAAALMALAADLTRDEVRGRTMAIIGVAIGASFSLALMLGPLLHAGLDLAALFWVAAGLAGLALILLFTIVPTPKAAASSAGTTRADLRMVLANRDLLRLDGGIFVLHLVMTGTFVAVPLALSGAGFGAASQWQVYLPVFLGSVALMAPLLMAGERYRRTRLTFLASIVLVALGQSALGAAGGAWPMLALGLLVFFVGFNLLEATLPALISRTAPSAHKGAAMGAYSASQFLGAFAGGVLAGVLDGIGGPPIVFAAMAALAALWLLAALPMRIPDAAVSYVVSLEGVRGPGADNAARDLSDLPGVEEAVVIEEEGVAYLRVDQRRFREADLQRAGYEAAEEAA